MAAPRPIKSTVASRLVSISPGVIGVGGTSRHHGRMQGADPQRGAQPRYQPARLALRLKERNCARAANSLIDGDQRQIG